MMRKALLVALSWLVGGAPGGAATFHVPRNHKTIQEAIAAAAPGDTVVVAAGTYRESVVLKERLTLVSAGDDAPGTVGLKRAEATVLDGGGAAARGPAVVLAEGAVLDGFTITRVGLFDQAEYAKHHATRGEQLPDEQGAVGVGGAYPAVACTGVTGVVQRCLVHDNGHPGIGVVGGGKGNTSLVRNNVAYRNMGGGIGIAGGATPTVLGNRCYNNLRAGIGIRKAGGEILDNECFDNVRAGIGIREGATPLVRGNRCHDNRRAGIGCRMEGTAPRIEANECHGNALAGIGCRDGARPVVSGNKCYRNKEAGIGCDGVGRALLTHNECYENDKAGIGQRGGGETILTDNHVHHNKLAGIGFESATGGTATVLRNRVVGNDLVAVGVHAGWTVHLAENTLSREGGLPPLVMIFQGATANLHGNTFTGSGVAGIRTEGTVRVVGNTFECPAPRAGGPPQFAVWGLPGADIVFTRNKVRGWRHALFAEKAAVRASFNAVADYRQVGIRVEQPTAPVEAIGNVFQSAAGEPGVRIAGAAGVVLDNRVEKPRPGE